ncbi:glycoside hydrolase family 43 protein [Sphingomonas sp. VNH70]|uniref:glycoside hydrolase family 43 protein n=1 Tax=Sphingomonas silueang TaxID=3156617 RepID=UPI0032B57D7F
MIAPRIAAALALFTLTAATGEPARFADFAYQGRSPGAAKPKAGEYANPILSGYYPDPSVLRVGEDYYLALSSFAHFPGIPIFHSRDLIHWTQIANAIDRPTQLNLAGRRASQGVFAPDISWHAGTFYIANTCVECGGNFVITAKDPRGPWSDPVWLPFEGIDPSIHWEGDRAWIVNNRAPPGPPRYDGHRAIWIQEYDWRAGRMVGDATLLLDGGVDPARNPVWIEGPHILKKDGWYYLLAAEGGTSVHHSQVALRARTLLGPYLPDPANPILTQRDLSDDRPHPITSAGHAKLVQTQRGDWWATFLAVRPYAGDYYNTGRETFLLPVRWQDGWPVILPKGQAIPTALPAPRLPRGAAPRQPTSGDFGYVDRFDGRSLDLGWIGLRNPTRPFYHLKDGELILDGGAPLGDQSGVPGFVGRRQQHAVATVHTTLRFVPEADDDRAGLAAIQSDASYLFFGLTRIAGRTAIALYTRAKGDERLVASAPLTADGPVTLTLRIDRDRMGFDYRVDGRSATLAEGVDARFLSTHDAGGFTGTVIGPYSWRR